MIPQMLVTIKDKRGKVVAQYRDEAAGFLPRAIAQGDLTIVITRI